MALSGTTNKVSFTPSAGTTTLEFTIPFFDATTIVTGTTNKFGDIKVTRLRSGTETALVPVSGTPSADQFKLTATNGDPAQGGTVTIFASTASDKFTIERDVNYTQEYDLQEGATIDPTALNKAFDRAVAQNQQQNDLFTRTVEFPVTDDAARTYTVGTETSRANKALGFDNDGNVTELDLAASGTVTADTNAGVSITGNQISAKVDNVTTQFSGGNIVVKQVDTAQIAADAITATEIDNNAVTTASIATGALTDLVYPVGSIFTTVHNYADSAAVVTAIGGTTWVRFGAGRVMVGYNASDVDFDTAEETGGAKTHALTFTEMPAHSHQWYKEGSGLGKRIDGTTGNPKYNSFDSDGNEEEFADPLSENLYTDTAHNRNSNGSAHNNLQPYVVVYMWKRTA